MTCWEYKTINPSFTDRNNDLTALGREGWELVSTTYDSIGNCIYYTLKRSWEDSTMPFSNQP